MPFIGELELEFCDQTTPSVTKEILVSAVHRTPREVRDWFLTLRRANDEYMDATMADDGVHFEIRCSEGGKTVASASPIDEALLESLVLSFYEHDNLWRQQCTWVDRPVKKGFSLRDLFKR
jgi:hypothetical protein